MVISKRLSDFKRVYHLTSNLLIQKCKSDKDEPLRLYHAARDLFIKLNYDLKTELDSRYENSLDDTDELLCIIMLGFVYRDLGRIYLSTEEDTMGEQYLNECLDLLNDHKLKEKAIILYLSTVNDLCVIYIEKQEYIKCLDLLKKAEFAYKEFIESGKVALSFKDIFEDSKDENKDKRKTGPKELEQTYTQNTHFRARIHEYLGEKDFAIKYWHLYVKRQLKTKPYDSMEVALRAINLGKYFIENDLFRAARQHFAGATMALRNHESSVNSKRLTEQQREEINVTYKLRYAELALGWIKYGITLLKASKHQLCTKKISDLIEEGKPTLVKPNFYQLPVDELKLQEELITTDYCFKFEDVKRVFHFVLSWLDQAREYYKVELFINEFTHIITSYAELYDLVSFFEDDYDNQIKMQKRRGKYYEEILETLNSRFYLDICREAWYGAGLSCNAIIDIQSKMSQSTLNFSTIETSRLNRYCIKGSKHFYNFIESYFQPDGRIVGDDMTKEEKQKVLLSYYYLGRMYYKMKAPNEAGRMKNATCALKYYEVFNAECAEHAEATQTMFDEKLHCKEMLHLLPIKIRSISKMLVTSNHVVRI